MSDSDTANKFDSTIQDEMECECELEEFLNFIDQVICDRKSFSLGEYGRSRADHIQATANSQARLRARNDPGFNKDWLDEARDDDVLYWAIGGEDPHVDILSSRNKFGIRRLLPGATPVEFDKRNARLKSEVVAQLGKPTQE